MCAPFHANLSFPLTAIIIAAAFFASVSGTSAEPDAPATFTPTNTTLTTTRIAHPDAWVSTLDEFAPTSTPEADSTYGFDYLLFDRQINAREQSNYTRTIYRITNANSLQSGARISWEYDPAYSTLTVHHIRVTRNGVTQDRLKPGILQTIQQERDYDRHLYDGRLTTFAVLEDIRVGDIIDYASTRKGWNPVFDGRLISHQIVSTGAPLRHQRLRIIIPADRTFSSKTIGPADVAPSHNFIREQCGGDTIHTWESFNHAPIAYEDNAPGWFTQYPWLQISEYPDWASVVRWAAPLYELPDPLPDAIRAKAIELTKNAQTESAKAVALLEFVQQEIRYLGMELGTGSYRPSPPASVLSRRFGDCKDKSLLYCALMRAVGLMAYPALVDTKDTRDLDNRLPSPGVFNHVIVFIRKSTDGGDIDTDCFVDPTITDQQGTLKYRGLPDYQRALVIRPGTTRLSTIDIPETARSSVRVAETYDSPAFDKPAALAIKITYAGLRADSVRSYLRQTAIDEVAKHYLNAYASTHPGITAAAYQPIRWEDNTERNTLTIEATYDIADFWTLNNDKTSWQCGVYAERIADYAAIPDTTKRTTPLGMGAPFFAEIASTINLPGEWTISPSAKTFESPGFIGKTEDKQNGKNQFITRASWEVTSDHVAPADVAKHVEALKKFRAELGTTLTHTVETAATAGPEDADAPFRTNWLIVFVGFLTLLICFHAARRLYTLPSVPPPIESAQNPELIGLGGWLILVGIGICISPLTLLASIGKDSIWMLDLDRWENLTHSASAAYQAGWAPALLIEYTMNMVLIATSVFLIVLFFARKRRFPAVFIFTLALVLVQHVVEIFVTRSLVEFETSPTDNIQNIGTMLGSIIRAAIWIPYALVSKRVKYTFTR